MTARRWWMLALTGASILCAVVLGLSVGMGLRFGIGVAILVAFAVFWALVFRCDEEGSARAVAVLIVTIAVSGALTAVDTSLAFFQAFAYPAAWTLLATARRAVLASAALAIVEGLALVERIGASPSSIGLAITIETVSFAFAISMGIWITRIADLGTERKRLFDELSGAQAELAAMHRDAGATGERERLARELHDTIAQSLTAQVLLAQRARRELASGALSDSTLELLETASREALAETRSLVAASARVELPGGGLVEALQQLGTRFERESGITVTVVSSFPVEVPLARDAEVVLLRCAQEGLANVRKHAGAHAVRLLLSSSDGFAGVDVVDDGRGFDPSSAAPGFGLSGLRDRLGLVGGSLSVDGTPGATTLTARLPLVAAPAAS
ncbi:MAG: sensor histidine kinase [Acidobacteria bacterium]|nr:sensor histidine kinase [Acidobacteriota bacterium]